MAKAKLTAEEIKAQQEENARRKMEATKRSAYLKHLKKENELMEEQIKYYQYQLALPKLHAEWEKMQQEMNAEVALEDKAAEPEVTTEEMGS